MTGEDLIDEIIVYMSAWRRLRHSFVQQGKNRPEHKEISDLMIQLMDDCYRGALADLKKQKASLAAQLKKARENTRYGRVGE